MGLQDPEAFEADGGWNFLDMEGDDEEDDDEEEEGDPEFEADGDDSDEAEASSDYRYACYLCTPCISYPAKQIYDKSATSTAM